MANEAYLQFVRDPDQASRRAELAAFIGAKAPAFLPIYDRMVATANRQPGEKVKFSLFGNGFNAGAFFVGPVWFFYRKMWAWAWGITALLVVLGLIPGTGRIGLPVGVGLAVGANQLYVTHAISRLQKMRAAGGGAALDLNQVAAAGGVSQTAAWVAGGIYLLLSVLAIYAIVKLGPDAMR